MSTKKITRRAAGWLWAFTVIGGLSLAGNACGQVPEGYFFQVPSVAPSLRRIVERERTNFDRIGIDHQIDIRCAKVSRVVFVGNTFVPEAWLRARIAKAGPIVCLIGNGLTGTTVDAEAEEMVRYYRSHGFRDVRVERELILEEGDETATVVFHIREGNRSLAIDTSESVPGGPSEWLRAIEYRPQTRLVELHDGLTRPFPRTDTLRQSVACGLLWKDDAEGKNTPRIPVHEANPQEEFKDVATRVRETALGGMLFHYLFASDSGICSPLDILNEAPLPGVRSLMGWLEPRLIGRVELRYGVLKDDPSKESVTLGCSDEIRKKICRFVRGDQKDAEVPSITGRAGQPWSGFGPVIQDVQPDNEVSVYFVTPEVDWQASRKHGFTRFVDGLNAGISPSF